MVTCGDGAPRACCFEQEPGELGGRELKGEPGVGGSVQEGGGPGVLGGWRGAGGLHFISLGIVHLKIQVFFYICCLCVCVCINQRFHQFILTTDPLDLILLYFIKIFSIHSWQTADNSIFFFLKHL